MTCDRCGSTISFFSTSYFNTDTICAVCEEKEQSHPRYAEAKRAENEAVARGDYNYPGIGLPPELRA